MEKLLNIQKTVSKNMRTAHHVTIHCVCILIIKRSNQLVFEWLGFEAGWVDVSGLQVLNGDKEALISHKADAGSWLQAEPTWKLLLGHCPF